MDTCVDMDQVLLRFGGTTSSQDQRDLLTVVKTDKKRPLSGPLILNKKNRSETTDRTVVNAGPTSDLFGIWSQSLLNDSITHFPTSVKLKIRKKTLLQNVNGMQILDPRFALVQMWHLLSARNLVDCEMFVKRNGLSYTLVALSSCQPCMRKVAYSTLQRFYRQLESLPHDSYKDRQLWLNFADVLRSSLTTENQQLRRMRTSFYSNAIPLIQNPDNLLFSDVRHLFLNHSHSDADIASDLIRFLKSAHPKNHSEAFFWSLTVIFEGLDQSEDFALLDKHHFVDLLLEFLSSPTITSEQRHRILLVIEKASRIKDAGRIMAIKNGLISFINELAFDESLGDDLIPIFRMACNLCTHLTEGPPETLSSAMTLELCEAVLCLSRHASQLCKLDTSLAAKYLEHVFKVISLVAEQRQSYNWLFACESDLVHIRSLNRQVEEASVSELAVADEAIAL